MKQTNQTYLVLGLSMIVIGIAAGFMASNWFMGAGFAGVGVVFLIMSKSEGKE